MSGRIGDTEQKAISRIDVERLRDLIEECGFDVRIEMVGHFSPCPYEGGCMNTLANFADETGVEINYMTANDQGVVQDYWFIQYEYPF
jgi:hypothetical protein